MRRVFQLALLLFFFSYLLYNPAFSFQKSTNNYVISHFGMEDGLPQSTVNDITQTPDGYMWLATFGGLVRYDGNSFTTFNRSNTPGMRSDRILHLYTDSDGTLWVATENGFLRYQDGEFKSYEFKLGTNIYAPSKVIEDGEGRLWITAGAAPYLYDGEEFLKQELLTDEESRSKALNENTGVWLAYDRKLLKTVGDSIALIDELDNQIRYNIVDVEEYPKGSGQVFIATTGQGVGLYEDGKLHLYSVDSGLTSRYTSKFYKDRSDQLWVTNFNGISKWQGEKFESLNAINLSKDIQYTKIFEDLEGNYWVGSPSEGLFKVRSSIITTIDSEEGLWNEKMLSLTQLRNGNYVFATNCGGVYEWKNNRATPAPINEVMPNLCVWSVYEDSRGDIWFGSRVLYRSSSLSDPGIQFGPEEGFDGFDIFAITEDRNGNIWIGCLNGVYVYDGASFTKFTTEEGLSYNDTRTLFEDSDGTMWVGTSQGLNTISKGRVTNIQLLEHKTDSVVVRQPYVRAIHKDNEGVYWIGTYGHGIFRIKNGHVTQIRSDDGLFDDIVSFIREDEQGFFWMGSNRGIFRVRRSELNKFSEGQIDRVQSYSYGIEEGMKSAETNGGFQPNVIQENGKLYIPTVEGVTVVATNKAESLPKPPPVYIERLTSGNIDLPLGEQINLPYDKAFLQVYYTALNFQSPEKVKFRYKLEGLNENWFEVGTRRSALFTKIPPGEYAFKVTANSNNGTWNPEVASFGVSVKPPFWMTTWFYFVVGLGILFTGVGLYHRRVTKLEEANKRQKLFTEKLIESQEQERRRIASELHDSLGQQILVIKNRAELAGLQVEDAEATARELQEIIQSAQRSIADVRNISHNLRPVHLEKFGLTNAVNQLCANLQETTSIDWSYHLEDLNELVEDEKVINLYRIIQEGTNNILKHSSATEASVLVKKNGQMLSTKIWDNGKGFDNTNEQKQVGLGFQGMNERITSLGGTLKVESTPGKGTTLLIQIPIPGHG
ncbi:MAG: ligand-binding sensor domain-containing protein [Bacteroidota bacterium]